MRAHFYPQHAVEMKLDLVASPIERDTPIMKTLALATLASLSSVLFAGALHAQSARLDVKIVSDASADIRMSEKVRRGTKTDENAPKLRLDATAYSSAGKPFQANLEWYVFGKTTAEGKQAGRTADLVVMQSSKEAVTVKPAPGAKTSFFAYAPGQIRDGAQGIGWIVRLVGADGRLLDARVSSTPFLPLARDHARLGALVAAKNQTGASGDTEVPLEILAKIKADAEKNWPGNPEMQAFEIQNKIDAHKAAYRK